MADRTSNFLNAYESTLGGILDGTSMSCTVVDATGLVEPFYLVIDPDDPALREYIRISLVSGTTLTISERYLTGSAAGSGLIHQAGATVRHTALAQAFEDLHDRVDAAVAGAGATDHGDLTGLGDDDHGAYHNDARAVIWHDLDDHSAVTPADIGAAPAAEGVTNGDTHNHIGGDGGQVDHGDLAGLGDDDHSGYHTDGRAVTWHDADDHSGLEHVLATFTELGDLSTKVGTVEFPLPYDCTITEVKLRVSTAPTGAAIIVDVNVDGVTIDTGTKPTIAATSKSGTDTAFTDASHLEDQVVSVDIDQVGSTVAGSNLVVVIIGTRD